MKPVIIKTRRLVLRPVTTADTRAFYEHSIIPEVAKNAGFLPSSISETRKYIAESVKEWHKAEPERMTFSILLKREKMWIGSLELRWLHKGVVEIGFFIHPNFWNNGYATEAARSTLAWVFSGSSTHRIQGSCWVRNRASLRVLGKLGLRKEGRLRGYVRQGERFQDDYLFAITLADWRKRRG